MNFAQLIGEKDLRISDLEELLEGRGIDHSAKLRGKQQVADLARERQAHRVEVAGMERRIGELGDTITRLRQQLMGRLTHQDVQAAVAAREEALLRDQEAKSLEHARRVELLNAEIDRLQGLLKSGSAAPAKVYPMAPAKPPRPGTCGAAIEAFLAMNPGPQQARPIYAACPGFSDGLISVALGHLVKRDRVLREGTHRHFTYELNQERLL